MAVRHSFAGGVQFHLYRVGEQRVVTVAPGVRTFAHPQNMNDLELAPYRHVQWGYKNTSPELPQIAFPTIEFITNQS